MKAQLWTVIFMAILLTMFFSIPAYAGVLDTVKGWISGEMVALALSTVLTVLGGLLGLGYRKVSRTLKETGEFMTTLGDALEDKRLTREEMTAIIKEGKEVFAIWR